MSKALREAERIIALDEKRKEWCDRVTKLSAGDVDGWSQLYHSVPEMVACIRGLYAHIAEHYGVDV